MDLWLDRNQAMVFVTFELEAGSAAGTRSLVFMVEPESLELRRVRVVVHDPGVVLSLEPESLTSC